MDRQCGTGWRFTRMIMADMVLLIVLAAPVAASASPDLGNSNAQEFNWTDYRSVPPADPTGTTYNAPALAYYHNRLYVAVTGRGLNGARTGHIFLSEFDGFSWSPYFPASMTPDIQTSVSPALAVVRDTLYLAVVDSDSQQVYLYTTTDGKNWTQQTGIDNWTTGFAPALAADASGLYIAVTGDNGQVYLKYYDGKNFTDYGPNTEGATQAAPALANVYGNLRVAVIGAGPNVYQLTFSPPTWTDANWNIEPDTSAFTKKSAPALLDARDTPFYLAIQGDNRIYVYRYDPATGWSTPTAVPQGESSAIPDSPPALARGPSNKLYLVVKGNDNHLYWSIEG